MRLEMNHQSVVQLLIHTIYLGDQSWYDHKTVVHFGAGVLVHHQNHFVEELIYKNRMEDFFVDRFHGTQGAAVVQ